MKAATEIVIDGLHPKCPMSWGKRWDIESASKKQILYYCIWSLIFVIRLYEFNIAYNRKNYSDLLFMY